MNNQLIRGTHAVERPFIVTIVATLGVISGLETLANAGAMLPMLGLLMEMGGTEASEYLFFGVPTALMVGVGLFSIGASVALFRGKRWGRTVLEVLIWGTVALGGFLVAGALIAGAAADFGALATLTLVGVVVLGLGPLFVIGYLLRLDKVEAFLRHSC